VTLFWYPLQDLVEFKSSTAAASISPLGGATAHFAVVGGSLPPGMTLDPASGAIVGVPLGTTATSATIAVTVDGYSGSVLTAFNQAVSKPGLWMQTAQGTYPASFQVGAPLPAGLHLGLTDPAVMIDAHTVGVGPLALASGSTVTYAVAPGDSLPPGIALDPTTGMLSGTPTALNSASAVIQATVTGQGHTDTISSNLAINVVEPTVRLSYSPQTSSGDLCLSSQAVPFATIPPGGNPVRFQPVFSGALPGDVFSNFVAHSDYGDAQPLNTLTLDPTTGVISGNAFEPNDACIQGGYFFTVSFTLTRGQYVKALSQQFLFVN
jgi:hypothetical protein